MNDMNFANLVSSEDEDEPGSDEDAKQEILIRDVGSKRKSEPVETLVLPPIEQNYELYYKKMTLIFGGTHTGKTTIVKNILYLLRNKIPNVFIIAPTNSSNNAFTGIVPPMLIKSTLDKKWLEGLWERQNDAAEIYELVNNPAELKRMFDLLSLSEYKSCEELIQSEAVENLDKLDVMDFNPAEKKSKKLQIKELENAALVKLYKSAIRKNRSLLITRARTKEDQIILKYLDLNPNILLLLDDCASQFKTWYRNKKCSVIKQIFYEGRHKFFTTIITAQDDKEIDSELRKNAMVNIFTSSQAALANFERPSNNYPKDVKETAKACISKVFEKPKAGVNYKKLVYIKDELMPFKYMIAELVDEFRMCCDSVWILSDRIKKHKTKYNKHNRFVRI